GSVYRLVHILFLSFTYLCDDVFRCGVKNLKCFPAFRRDIFSVDIKTFYTLKEFLHPWFQFIIDCLHVLSPLIIDLLFQDWPSVPSSAHLPLRLAAFSAYGKVRLPTL